jgi:hypothetical protein
VKARHQQSLLELQIVLGPVSSGVEVGEGWFVGWFCFVVKTKYPIIAIVMPKEMIEKPMDNVLSHEAFGISLLVEFIKQIISHKSFLLHR